MKENCHALVNQFHENFPLKTLSCGKIKSVFRYLNASWGFKGLNLKPQWCPRRVVPVAQCGLIQMTVIPVNKRWYYVGLMLGRHRRRWPSIKPTSGHLLVFAFMSSRVRCRGLRCTPVTSELAGSSPAQVFRFQRNTMFLPRLLVTEGSVKFEFWIRCL